jgi:hypothetical protein
MTTFLTKFPKTIDSNNILLVLCTRLPLATKAGIFADWYDRILTGSDVSSLVLESLALHVVHAGLAGFNALIKINN